MNRKSLVICLCCIVLINGIGIQGLKKTEKKSEPENQQFIKKENEKEIVHQKLEENLKEVQEEIQEKETPEEISVAIMNEEYTTYFHERVELEFQGEYQEKNTGKIYKDKEKLILEKGEESLQSEVIYLSPYKESDNQRVKLLSVRRGEQNPSYRGTILIGKDEDGWYIVNKLPLEEYLYGVVPSEMPSSYQKEALKAQAVCARTYAWMQMQKNQNSIGIKEAQVDDSVSYQVYQNTAESEAAIEAVDATNGEVLTENGQPITAYYFSTSHGKTSTNEVWEASALAGYLQSVACEFDSNMPWYRWKIFLSSERLQEQARERLSNASKLEKMKIEKIGESDAVLELMIETDAGVIRLKNEYEIREFLSPKNLEIVRQDESVVKGGKLLPSAYFTLEEQTNEEGKPQGYMIHGGGYGHGVGMSQNGANEMAKLGKNYKEILTYFYKDVEIASISGL